LYGNKISFLRNCSRTRRMFLNELLILIELYNYAHFLTACTSKVYQIWTCSLIYGKMKAIQSQFFQQIIVRYCIRVTVSVLTVYIVLLYLKRIVFVCRVVFWERQVVLTDTTWISNIVANSHGSTVSITVLLKPHGELTAC
jgi:hypothetical protein